MGRGSYTASDWASLRASRNLAQTETVTRIFSRREPEPTSTAPRIMFRESRDSSEHARSTPIIIGFDVTASMGYLAKELATNSLNNTIMNLLRGERVSDPQILCAAIGDCKSDRYPLQVTQFESDIRMVRQLLELHLEGGGGGNDGESYNLLWYFAARHTHHDHFEKRGGKGYLFTVGDDCCHGSLSTTEIRKNFTSRSQYDLSNQEILREAEAKYHVFHVHLDRGTAADREIFQTWALLLPGRCVRMDARNIDCLSELIAAIISLTEGSSLGSALKGLDEARCEKLLPALATLETRKKKTVISF